MASDWVYEWRTKDNREASRGIVSLNSGWLDGCWWKKRLFHGDYHHWDGAGQTFRSTLTDVRSQWEWVKVLTLEAGTCPPTTRRALTIIKKTLPKAQRTRGLCSYHKFLHTSWSNSESRVSIYSSISNLNLEYWPNLGSESWPRFNFVTSTKHQQNTDQISALNLAWVSTSKSWPKLVLKVWTKV